MSFRTFQESSSINESKVLTERIIEEVYCDCINDIQETSSVNDVQESENSMIIEESKMEVVDNCWFYSVVK